MDEEQELEELLSQPGSSKSRSKSRNEMPDCTAPSIGGPATSRTFNSKPVQWSTFDGKIFVPTATTITLLPPGYYEIYANPEIGLYFENVPIKLDGILNFPDAVTSHVVEEIQKFWERENLFKEFKLTHKRGQMLWGPQGGGKTTTLQLVSKDVIERGGVVIKFGVPEFFSSGLRKLREIQPDTPVVVLMEDLDAIIDTYNESEVINILDGVDKLDKIVFLATTNYPELLGDRIMNRPSRFDKRYRVGYINAESRKMYFEFLIDNKNVNVDINRWVEDTQDFSIAHLKELFVAVVILGDPYDVAITRLRKMSTRESSTDNGKPVGFRQFDD